MYVHVCMCGYNQGFDYRVIEALVNSLHMNTMRAERDCVCVCVVM